MSAMPSTVFCLVLEPFPLDPKPNKPPKEEPQELDDDPLEPEDWPRDGLLDWPEPLLPADVEDDDDDPLLPEEEPEEPEDPEFLLPEEEDPEEAVEPELLLPEEPEDANLLFLTYSMWNTGLVFKNSL
jgi:hypothetical protein